MRVWGGRYFCSAVSAWARRRYRFTWSGSRTDNPLPPWRHAKGARKTADVMPDICKTDSNTLAVTCCCCPGKPQVLGFCSRSEPPPPPLVPISAQIQAALDRSSASIPRGGLSVSSHRCRCKHGIEDYYRLNNARIT